MSEPITLDTRYQPPPGPGPSVRETYLCLQNPIGLCADCGYEPVAFTVPINAKGRFWLATTGQIVECQPPFILPAMREPRLILRKRKRKVIVFTEVRRGGTVTPGEHYQLHVEDPILCLRSFQLFSDSIVYTREVREE